MKFLGKLYNITNYLRQYEKNYPRQYEKNYTYGKIYCQETNYIEKISAKIVFGLFSCQEVCGSLLQDYLEYHKTPNDQMD